MSIYGFRGGPAYRASNPQEQMIAAFERPMSLGSTFWDQAKGGALDSFGLGTIAREMMLPAPAPVVKPWNSQETDEQFAARREAAQPMSEDAYKASAFFRDDVPWDAGMTEDRAAALADMYDRRKVREFFAEKRPITSFIAGLAGQATDPVNYIPVAGPLVRAAAVARLGSIGGRIAIGALDAAGNTAAASVLTREARRSFGDDVSWQATISEVATAALIGSAFGGVSGLLARRGEGKVAALRQEADRKLATLKTTQEARIALNDAIDGLANDGEVRLGPNATASMARMAGEVERLSRAYDDVLASPTGPVDDPLVRIRPDDIEALIVARGAFKNINEVEFSKSGKGLVKVIWGHGEKSGQRPEFQVTKDDVAALPQIVREFEPVPLDAKRAAADSPMRTWRVERNGRTIVYGDKGFDGAQQLVTINVMKPGSDLPLSVRKSARPVPSDRFSAASKDTAEGLTIGNLGAERATANIARPPVIDNSAPMPEPLPEGRMPAEQAIGKAENAKSLADQYGVDPATGAYPEEAELRQMIAEGRVTEEEAATLQDADDALSNSDAYGEALKTVVGCLL